ncbi:MAG: hypothetical protein H0X30_38105 [Anaerolineae bacterium]|nr:hypothetical protein [Anaerolineae bacterium]
MGLQVYWEDEQKVIIRQVYDLTWTWDEFLKAFEEIRRLGSEVDYPIGMISEIGLIRSVPPNAILYGARGIRSLPNNIFLTVMVTSSPLALSFLKVILSVGQFQNIRTAPTVEIARQMIAEKHVSQMTKMRV